MKNFRMLASGLPVEPLLERVRAQPEDAWLGSELRKHYPGSAHAAADTLLLRWPDDRGLDAAFRSLDAADTLVALELCPELPAVTNNLADRVGRFTSTGRCMITRLPAGAGIPPHVDEGHYANIYDRFHVCLAGDAEFRCGDERIRPLPGEAFWFNRKLLHGVRNGLASDRYHLILDLEAPHYQRERGQYMQQEDIRDAWAEMMAIYPEHYEEVAFYKDIPLAPDEDSYMRIAPNTRLYTVRHGAELVGYALFIVRQNPHYKTSLTAVQDVIYLKPAHRRGLTGVRLIRLAEERLRAEGVQVVYHHAKRSNQFGDLLGRLGYELVDQLYAKRLDKKKGE